MHARRQRRVAASVLALASSQRHCSSRATVKPAAKHNYICAPSCLAGQLDRRLDGLGAAITEEETVERRIDHLAQRTDQIEHWAVIDNIGLAVQQPAGLLANRGDDPWMAVAGVRHADAAGEIEIAAAVGIV